MRQRQIFFQENDLLEQTTRSEWFKKPDGSEYKQPFVNGNKMLLSPVVQQNLRAERRLPILKEEPKEFLVNLFFYLDQIVYLEEMSEKIERLEIAINSRNTKEINWIAAECLSISANCGMLKIIQPLNLLSSIKEQYILADGLYLSNQVKREFEQFRFAFKINLEQLASQTRSVN